MFLRNAEMPRDDARAEKNAREELRSRKKNTHAGRCRGRSLPNHRTVQARQMPWLTLGAPGRMTCLHQAHTKVGRRRAAWMAVFMIGKLDSSRARTFTVFL